MTETKDKRMQLPTIVVGVLVRALATFGFSKLIATSLGPTEFSRYGHFYMLASYLITASSLGLGSAITVYIAGHGRESANEDTGIGSIVALITTAGIVIGIAISLVLETGLGGSWLPRVTGGQVLLWLLFCVTVAAATAFQSVLLGKEKHKLYQSLASGIPLVACIALVLVSRSHHVTPEVGIACYMLGYIFPVFVFLKTVRFIPKISLAMVGSVARFVVPYIAPSLLIPTVGTISVLSLRYFVAVSVVPRELGLWQALWRLSESYMGALVSVGTALLLPRFSQLRYREEAKTHVVRGALILVGLYVPIAAAFLIAPDLSLRFLLSREYTGIAGLLPLQIVGDILKILCFVQGLFFTALLRPKLTLFSESLFATLVVVLAFLLTPYIQTQGAVAAYTGAYLVLLCTLVPLTRRCIRRLPSSSWTNQPTLTASDEPETIFTLQV